MQIFQKLEIETMQQIMRMTAEELVKAGTLPDLAKIVLSQLGHFVVSGF
jgi:hypothetical protein